MIKRKLYYVLSNIDKAVAFEWITEKLDQQQYQLSFVLLNPGGSELEKFLRSKRIPCKRVTYRGKKNFFTAFISLFLYLRKHPVDVVHCHMFDASLVGLLACKLAGVKKRIYTRHHSTYNWIYNRKGVKYDRLINWLATDIVAISENVNKVLISKESVTSKKVHLIHHGFDLQAFSNVEKERIKRLKERYNPEGKKPVIGVIARWIEWKGIQYVIPAFKRLLKDYPNAFLVLANAKGPYHKEIEKLLSAIPEKSYRLIEFEPDLFALYQLFDMYVHVPVDPHIEAFGQTYVEALAAGIPSVFTQSGVGQEIINRKNAKLVSYKNSTEIYESIIELIEDPESTETMVKIGLDCIGPFSIEKYIRKLEYLYNIN